MFDFYPLTTMPGHEKRAKRDLEQRLHNLSLIQHVRQITIPQHSVTKTKKDGVSEVVIENPVPGYMIIEAALNDDVWSCIIQTPGVRSLAPHGVKPTPLKRVEVDRLMQTVSSPTGAKVVQKPDEPRYEIRDIVQIVGGPFSGTDAEVMDVEGVRIKVEIAMGERAVNIEIGPESLRLIRRPA